MNLNDGAIESGQGRWDEIVIEGLSFVEYLKLAARQGESLDDVLAREPGSLQRYLTIGGFPEHVLSTRTGEVLSRIRHDVVERAILRDLRRTGTDLDRVKRLFVYLVTSSGQIWNTIGRSDDLGSNPKSTEAWLHLLQATHLVQQLEDDRIHGVARDSLRAKVKVYAADHGLVTAMSYAADPIAGPPVRGQVFEAVVFQHLRAFVRGRAARLSYFRRSDRTRAGDLEIDFVIRSGRVAPVAIEVTSAKQADARKIQRLRQAADVVKAGRRIVVTGGISSGRVEDVEVYPLHEFLRRPEELLEGIS